ncbi:MAG: hypothetical protein K0R29_2536 [Pseudobdellovibrio sp.]|jgi:type II secretory pathway component GspD/PulD (secretin)|nr:hypothetical protein [Pseudobdellovibrio sp.]
MKNVFIAAVLLVSNMALAAINNPIKAFDIEMNLSIDGKQVSTPRIIVKEGEKGVFTQEVDGQKSIIEVVAKEIRRSDLTKAIKMEFTVSKIDADGKVVVLSTPKIIAANNSEAQITVGETGRPEALSLSVVANKLNF